jgi:queuine tRNA-ribosyltransferase
MFKIISEDGKTGARTGQLHTAHGVAQTPFLMPVATKMTVKYLTQTELLDMGVESIISNSMILTMAPGVEHIKEMGGIHKFMNFNKCIFTDSGGFQMQSPKLFLSISDRGVHFRDPFSGKKTFLTPEAVMKNEIEIGADVAMCLDQMPHTTQTQNDWVAATKRTHAWAERCKSAHRLLEYNYGEKQLLFGIAQGGLDEKLRIKSAKFIEKLDFDGVAMGGLCLGESKEAMFKAVDYQVPIFNKEKARYLMGVGSPEDILEAVSKGVDCFDSIYPTQNARHCNIFTSKGTIKIDRGKYAKDTKPLDENCDCEVCKTYSRAYLYHLIRMKEKSVLRHLSYHNVYFTQKLLQKTRVAIKENRFKDYKDEFLSSQTP